jgi:hypothetical protein
MVCRTSILNTPGTLQHLLFQDGPRSLQLIASDMNVMQPTYLLTKALVKPHNVRPHLSALRCLNELNSSGRLHRRHFPPESRSRRLAFILQALDGWLDNASYRDIAAALFGRARIEADWSDPGDHLRDRVRRAVRRGRSLMDGGYHQFLR